MFGYDFGINGTSLHHFRPESNRNYFNRNNTKNCGMSCEMLGFISPKITSFEKYTSILCGWDHDYRAKGNC